MNTKKCSKCKIEQTIENFNKFFSRGNYKLDSRCKKCKSEEIKNKRKKEREEKLSKNPPQCILYKEKKCYTCKQVKSLEEFYKDKWEYLGVRDACKKCEAIRFKKAYYGNKNEYYKQKSKEYREKNRDKLLKYNREYHKKNKQKISERKHNYNAIPEVKVERAKKVREKRKMNSFALVVNRLRSSLTQAFKRYSSGGKVGTSKKYGINYKAIFDYIGSCPGKYEDYHIDHIEPLCSFNLDVVEQVKLAFAPENHRWITKKENLQKVVEDKKKSLNNKTATKETTIAVYL